MLPQTTCKARRTLCRRQRTHFLDGKLVEERERVVKRFILLDLHKVRKHQGLRCELATSKALERFGDGQQLRVDVSWACN